MSVVNILDRVTHWAREDVCSKILLKVPPVDETAATDADYEYQRVHPAAFTMYVPTKDKLPPPIISPIPSICVRFLEGTANIGTRMGSIGIQLCFSTWDPGTHGKDIILPSPEDGMKAIQWTGPEAEAYFQRNGGGWRDVWNMVDIALAELESLTDIDGLLIDRSTPVKFGPLTEQEAIPDFYPFWFAWVSFTINYTILRPIRGTENFL